MQFSASSTSDIGASLSGVSSPGINGLTLQPDNGNSEATRKLVSNESTV